MQAPLAKGTVKAALLQWAIRFVEEQGYHDLNLDHFSKEYQVSHAAPYRHFPSKVALLAELARLGFEDLVATQRRFLAGEPTGSRAQMLALSAAYVDFLVRRGQLFDVMWDFTWTEERNPDTAARGQESFQLFAGAVDDYLRVQEIDPALRGELLMNIWSFLHGLAVLSLHKPEIVQPTPEKLEQLVRSGMNALLDGYQGCPDRDSV
jgi:AcrR family transcriptional regulator